MIIVLLDFILLGVAIIKYYQRRYVAPLVIFTFFVTNGFIISFGGITTPVKHMDYALLQIIITSVIMYFKNKQYFNINNDTSGKVIFIFSLFFLFEFIRTVISGFDTFIYALTDIRLWFIPFSYFIFRKIDVYSFFKAGKIIFWLTIISSILYIIQYFTHIELIDTYIGDQDNNYRMQIVPAFLEFFILYLMFWNRKVTNKYLYIILFLGVLYLAQNRTPIITIALLGCLFLVIKRNLKYTIIAIVASIIAFPIFSTMFEARTEGQTSLLDKDALWMVETMDYDNLQKESNFFFRIAIMLERGEYLIDHSDKILLGVGSIHEDSPNNNFDFLTGTQRIDGPGRGQLHSIDIMWCSPLIQYGLLGMLLIFLLIAHCSIIFFKNRNDYPQMISFLIFIGFIIQSFSSNSLGFSHNLFFMSIMLAYNYSYNGYLKRKVYRTNIKKIQYDTTNNSLLLVW